MADRVIAEERWSHVLFQRDSAYLLTFLSGGPVEVDHTIRLPEALALSVAHHPDQLGSLVEQCRGGSLPVGAEPYGSPAWPAA